MAPPSSTRFTGTVSFPSQAGFEAIGEEARFAWRALSASDALSGFAELAHSDARRSSEKSGFPCFASSASAACSGCGGTARSAALCCSEGSVSFMGAAFLVFCFKYSPSARAPSHTFTASPFRNAFYRNGTKTVTNM